MSRADTFMHNTPLSLPHCQEAYCKHYWEAPLSPLLEPPTLPPHYYQRPPHITAGGPAYISTGRAMHITAGRNLQLRLGDSPATQPEAFPQGTRGVRNERGPGSPGPTH